MLTKYAFCVVMCVIISFGAAVGAWAQSNPDEQSKDARIDLAIPDMKVSEALQMLSDATGFNILPSSKITGNMTAYVLDMEPERALKEIIEVNGYHYVREDDVVWVLTDEEYYEDFNLGRERRVVKLLHARAADVAAMLPDAMSVHGNVIAYPETNVIVLGEVEERVEEVAALARQLDIPAQTRVFQLAYAAAADMVALLQAHAPSPDALQADVRTNQVVIKGTKETLARLGSLLEEFDKADKVSTRTFPLKYANADTTAELLREVLTGRRQSSQGGQSSYSSRNSQEQPRVFTTQPSHPSQAAPKASWSSYKGRSKASSSKQPAQPTSPQQVNPPLHGGPTVVGPDSGESIALGPLASVAADPRTNSVIVTHVESVLLRLEQIIESVDVPSDFHTFQLQNANPDDLDLETKLAGLLPAENGFLSIDPLTRKVTFRAPADQAREIRKLLEEWDATIRQVRIDAEILRVNVSLIRQLGISWQALADEVAAGGEIVNRISGQVTFPPPLADTAPQTRLNIGTLSDDDYTVLLQAIATDSDAQILANPRVTVRDGREAIFASTRDEPYTVVTVDGNTQTTLEDVRFLNVGISLIVAPIINQNDLVTLGVQVEISNQVEVRNGIPVVDRATAQSDVSVRDGGTIVLGGLRQRSRSKVTSGVPGLRKIPGLGALFRSKKDDNAEFEIILILRPHIVGTHQETVPTMSTTAKGVGAAMEEEVLSDIHPTETTLDIK